MESKVLIELIDVVKQFDDGDVIVDHLNLKIYKNEFITLLGPSGCGKTTTLKMIGGFESPTQGHIVINGEIFNDLPAYARPIHTVFQSYALFPHLNVLDNVAFGLNNRSYQYLLDFYQEETLVSLIKDELKIDNVHKRHIKKKIKALIKRDSEAILQMVGLKGLGERKITQLSGGQQQRVALARALVNKPEILLLDEPLAALDLKLRKTMQYELKEMQKKLGITFIFVTHDQEEAMTMSDRIVVMKEGVIQQLGTPKHIYNEPVNRYVATFIGDSNIVRGVYVKKDLVNFLNVDFECMGYTFENSEIVDVVIRPEDFDVVELEKAKLVGTVENVIFKGIHNELSVLVQQTMFKVNTYENFSVGDQIGLKVDPYEIHMMKVEDNGN